MGGETGSSACLVEKMRGGRPPACDCAVPLLGEGVRQSCTGLFPGPLFASFWVPSPPPFLPYFLPPPADKSTAQRPPCIREAVASAAGVSSLPAPPAPSSPPSSAPSSSAARYPLARDARELLHERVMPEQHAGYAATWLALSGATLYMASGLIRCAYICSKKKGGRGGKGGIPGVHCSMGLQVAFRIVVSGVKASASPRCFNCRGCLERGRCGPRSAVGRGGRPPAASGRKLRMQAVPLLPPPFSIASLTIMQATVTAHLPSLCLHAYPARPNAPAPCPSPAPFPRPLRHRGRRVRRPAREWM